jgi:hypothetical protein
MCTFAAAQDFSEFPQSLQALGQSVLELMHKRRDDQANVSYHSIVVFRHCVVTRLCSPRTQVRFLFLTPIKRPSRPMSRNSYRSSRPGTPVFTPSPLAQGFRRPSTPLASGGPIASNYPSGSPSSSPVPANAQPNPISTGAGATSPSGSPRFLNAKAPEFRPSIVRSMSSSYLVRPSPASAEMWAHHYLTSPTLSRLTWRRRPWLV